MFRLIVLSALVASALGGDVLSQCVSQTGSLPTSFEVVGCSSTPCTLHHGEDAVFKVKFFSPSESKSLTSLLTGVVVIANINLPVPYDLGAKSQACNALTDAACPVAAGQELEYSLNLPIDYVFPVGARFFVELRVVDDMGAPAFCARTSVLIAASRS